MPLKRLANMVYVKSTTTVEEEIALVMNWAVENKMIINLR